ncbi:MAG: hypothetical protein J6I56_02490 [Lachnospiraceae bacterium]|nr:hypothetical protein [Lachnospiraceae bacterium]
MNFRQRQAAIAKRRLVPLALSALYSFVCYVIATVLVLADGAERAQGFATRELFLANLRNTVSTILGCRQIFWIFVVIGAVIVGIEGFSYLYDRKKIDFYASQPMKQRTRFSTIYVSGLFIFFVPFVTGLALATLVAAAYGVVNGALLADIACGAVRVSLLYLAVYHITMVGALLAGTTVMGNLVTAFLLLAEPVAVLTVTTYMSTFFSTYFEDGFLDKVHLSPVFHYLEGVTSISGGADRMNALLKSGSAADVVRSVAQAVWAKDLVTAGIAIAAFFAARALFLRRKNETAGTAIAFSFAKPVLKFVICIVSTLVCGLVVSAMTGGRHGGTTLLTAFILAIAAAVLCCMAEVIFAQSIRAAFKNIWQIPLIAGLSILIFFIFRYDLLGYDRYVPAPDKMESAALRIYGNQTNFFTEDLRYLDAIDFAKEHMFLRNTEAVAKLGELGQAKKRNQWEAANYEEAFNGILIYRLKNGRTCTRRIAIPTSVDPELMDSLMYTNAFREGAFEVYGNEAVEDLIAQGTLCRLQYTDGLTTSEHITFDKSDNLYASFADAYREDLKQFSYSMVRGSAPCGRIDFNYGTDRVGSYVKAYQSFDVYPCYTHTIAFLERHGIRANAAAAERAQKVTRIVVTKYLPEEEMQDIPDYPDDGPTAYYGPTAEYYGAPRTLTAEYTDRAQIVQILENYCSTELSTYLHSYGRDNLEVTVETAYDSAQSVYQDSYVHYGFFDADGAPGFVIRDLELLQKQ